MYIYIQLQKVVIGKEGFAGMVVVVGFVLWGGWMMVGAWWIFSR